MTPERPVIEKHLRTLRADFIQASGVLEEVARLAIEEAITRYPIFVAAQRPVALGVEVTRAANWIFSVAPIEELARKGLIDSVSEFKKTYLDPFTRACILLLPPDDSAKFIFIPYDLEPDKDI